MNISSISSIAPIVAPKIDALPSAGSSAASGTFGQMMSGAINQVESARSDANESVNKFLSGDGGDLHTTVLSMQRADLEFNLAMQVRNKVVSAYQEVMRMQV